MKGLRIADTSRWPVVSRAALIGTVVGALGWIASTVVGGGDNLTQQALLGQGTVAAVTWLLVLRFVLGVLSYAACTPGGLFAPMLVLGSHLGLLVGLVGHMVAPQQTPEPAALARIAMAAFFTATVRAPVTGIVLATEMTSSTTLLAPMLGACAIAMLAANAFASTPIYDQLTRRAVSAFKVNAVEASTQEPVAAGRETPK
jgi:CIC family chloride channel protein